MKKYLLLILGFAFTFSLSAQIEIKGTVVSEKGKPLRNANVWIKNTQDRVKTNKKGEFVLDDLSGSDTIVIAVSRRHDVVIPLLNNNGNITIILNKNEFTVRDSVLKEVLYPYSDKEVIRFNPNILTRRQIEQSGANSLYDLLRGNLPGVSVSDSSGKTMVTIRGGSSFELNNESLFIIDGVEYRSSDDADSSINVSDIEQLEVLSDGSTYGIKGANGAIIITTRNK